MTRHNIAAALLALGLLSGCTQQQTQKKLSYEMGERVTVGPFTYVVVESAWQTQLGELLQMRVPENRFLLITLSVTNGGGAAQSIPLLTLQGSDGKTYQELSDGTGVGNWIGLQRNVDPAQTLQGRLLFDVPLSSFKLRLPSAGEEGYEQFAMVDIPLRIDIDSVQTPSPGDLIK
jgi:hypothetical protein